jgi:hypothetical protein
MMQDWADYLERTLKEIKLTHLRDRVASTTVASARGLALPLFDCFKKDFANVTIADENDVISVPAGTTVRFGFAPNWSQSITFTTATTFTATNSFSAGDP